VDFLEHDTSPDGIHTSGGSTDTLPNIRSIVKP